MSKNLVIVGGGAAGPSVAAEAKRQGPVPPGDHDRAGRVCLLRRLTHALLHR